MIVAKKSLTKPYFGAHGEEETPVTIPNTEVKLPSGDYTANQWETSTVPNFEKTLRKGSFFILK